MLYNFTIFSKGGIILWRKDMQHLEGDPISDLVRDLLLQEKHNEVVFNTKDQKYALQWEQDNERELYFVTVVPRGFPAPYVPTLLERVRSKFTNSYPKCEEFGEYSEFTTSFEKILTRTMKELSERSNAPRKFEETEKGKKVASTSTKKPTKIQKDVETSEDKDKSESENAPVKLPPGAGRRRGRGGRPMRTGARKKKDDAPKPKPVKIMRKWDDVRGPVSGSDIEELDISRGSNNNSTATETSNDDDVQEIVPEIRLEEDSSSEEDDLAPAKSGFFGKYLPSLTGKALTAEQLEPIMDQFKTHLTEKNVASDIAKKLCDSVAVSLEGTKLSTFGSAKKIVNEAMKESLTKILTPKKQLDIMREIRAVNATGRPYSIVFVGVNGVGKSTSLSKVCSWLQQNELKVLIAACDTFRSGAVEQLKVHASRLGTPLFEQGYGKDASHIAAAAIKKAKQDNVNVVLVDTAGRMQDNEPLMKALSSLVHYNNPDLVLFVGEALVGNDGVHQLQNFNRSLELLSAKTSTTIKKDTIIDGVMLTKFDTIDDKVGAAVSMVYSTGIPIMFVGVGQHYQDLKKLNVGTVVKALMK